MKNLISNSNVSGYFDIQILKDGTWLHENRPIRRMELVKLFSTVLMCDDQGQHWLKTPIEQGKINVEDSAFVSCDVTIKGHGTAQTVSIRTNIDQDYIIGKNHPLYLKKDKTGAAVPYVLLDKNISARVTRSHFYELVKHMVEKEGVHGIWSDGIFYPLEMETIK